MYTENKKSKFSEIDILINNLNSDSKTVQDKSRRILKLAIEKLIQEGANAQ